MPEPKRTIRYNLYPEVPREMLGFTRLKIEHLLRQKAEQVAAERRLEAGETIAFYWPAAPMLQPYEIIP